MEQQTAEKERQDASVSSMADLLRKIGTVRILKEGDVVEGKIISLGKNELLMDIDAYGVGVVRGRDLWEAFDMVTDKKPGDVILAKVVELENKDGMIELSLREAGEEKVWQELFELMRKHQILKTKILDANKGGLIVEINGMQGFLPVSQLTVQHYPRVEEGSKHQILEILKELIGQELSVQIITADRNEQKLIVSEKSAYETETLSKVARYKIGDLIEGTVSGVVEFGIFVKFDEGLEGLVHISEISWKRIGHPRELYKVGDSVQAQIIAIERDRISLSVKRMEKDPWEEEAKKYQVGTNVQGTVKKLTAFGAFVELDPVIYGLCHINELANEPVSDPSQVLGEGETREFKIISIEAKDHRLGLSIKALTANMPTSTQAMSPTTADEPTSTDHSLVTEGNA